MLDGYDAFFDSIKDFKNKQIRQKQRGLNDFNILTSVLKPTDEVRLHSGMIKSLLDVNGEHGQESLFLSFFLEVIEVQFFPDLDKCLVFKEYENIDIYVTDGIRHLIIENKIHAGDQKHQIKRYVEKIDTKSGGCAEDEILVVYLTLNGGSPSEYSLSNLTVDKHSLLENGKRKCLYRSMSYRSNVLDWLERSKFEVQNISNLNESIQQYIDVVKIVTNQYKSKTMRLSEYLIRDEQTFELAMKVANSLPKARKKVVDDYFDRLSIKLEEYLGEGWLVEVKGNLSKKWHFPFQISRDSWGDRALIYGFEFRENDYYSGVHGIVRRNDTIDIDKEVLPKFKEDLFGLVADREGMGHWWLWREAFPRPGKSDFPSYLIQKKYHLQGDAEDDFFNKIKDVLDRFERSSRLLSRINETLNNQQVAR